MSLYEDTQADVIHDINAFAESGPVNTWEREDHPGLRLQRQKLDCGNSSSHQTCKIACRDFNSHGHLIKKEVLSVFVGTNSYRSSTINNKYVLV